MNWLQQHLLFNWMIYSFTGELNSKRKLARRRYMISMADYRNLFIDVLLTVLAELSAKSIRIDKNDKAIK